MKRTALTPSAPDVNAGRKTNPNASSDTPQMQPSDAVCQKSSSVTRRGIIAGSAARLRWKFVD